MRAVVLLLVSALFLTACGQMGALYLPKKPQTTKKQSQKVQHKGVKHDKNI